MTAVAWPGVGTRPPRATAAPLLERIADQWFLGGLGIVVWAALHGLVPFGLASPLLSVLFAVAGPVGAAHLGSSLVIAYGPAGPPTRRHPWAMVVLPLLVLVVSVGALWQAATSDSLNDVTLLVILMKVLFAMTGWHFIKQNYGVAMLVAAKHGLRFTPEEKQILRFGLYPLWAVDAMLVLVKGYDASFGGINVSIGAISHTVENFALLLAAASGGLVALTVVMACLRTRVVAPFALVAGYLTAFLWILERPTDARTTVLFAALHGVQYLWCSAAVERSWHTKPVQQRQLRFATNAVVLVGASWLLVNAVPRWLASGHANGAWAALPLVMFAACNLHHYCVDAVIWRSKGPVVRRLAAGSD